MQIVPHSADEKVARAPAMRWAMMVVVARVFGCEKGTEREGEICKVTKFLSVTSSLHRLHIISNKQNI